MTLLPIRFLRYHGIENTDKTVSAALPMGAVLVGSALPCLRSKILRKSSWRSARHGEWLGFPLRSLRGSCQR